MHRSELPDDPFPRAGAVPVLVEGFGSSVGELDDDVIRSRGDAAAAAGTAIKLLGDRSDQDDLVIIVIDASTTVSSARQRRVFVHPLILPGFHSRMRMRIGESRAMRVARAPNADKSRNARGRTRSAD